jgi:ribosomal protein S12 methylthiotransferase
VSFVSLGCPKALVDSERIITRLRAEGYELTRQHQGSDLVIVNTCGFLDSAKAESLGAIGSALKENGKVIVTGCMGAEPENIAAAYPDVLAITGPQQYESVLEAVHRAVPPKHDPFLDLVPPEGIKLTPRHYAYLKISEGCNNRCSFCIIPKLRGDLVSRPAADVLREAEKLIAAGVKELLVISQDTSAYGVDIKYAASKWRDKEVRAKFLDLASALGELGVWVRLHYVYPYPHVDDVIALMAERKVLPYLDIPFQHASPDVLKRMKRPAAQEKTLARDVSRPDAALDLHRRFPRRDRRRLRLSAAMARRGRARSRRLFQIRAGEGRAGERSRRRCAGRREGEPLAPLHAGAAEDFRAPHQA